MYIYTHTIRYVCIHNNGHFWILKFPLSLHWSFATSGPPLSVEEGVYKIGAMAPQLGQLAQVFEALRGKMAGVMEKFNDQDLGVDG